MTVEEFCEQEIRLGLRIHRNDGVWWRERAPFYYRPAYEFQEVVPDSATPSPRRALAGYVHVVPGGHHANAARSVMALDRRGDAAPYTISELTSRNTRNHIRRGLKECEIRRIDDLRAIIQELQAINIATRRRTGVGLPEEYYVTSFNTWKRNMLALFDLPGREWWGAYQDGRLIAYIHAYLVGDVMTLNAAKSLTEALRFHPNDALVYSATEAWLNALKCRRIVYGDFATQDPALNHFKKGFGYARLDIPAYEYLTPPGKLFALLRRGRLHHSGWPPEHSEPTAATEDVASLGSQQVDHQ